MEDTHSVPAFLCDVPPFQRIRKKSKEVSHHLIYIILASFVSSVYIITALDYHPSAVITLLGMFYCIFSTMRFVSNFSKLECLLGGDDKTAAMLYTFGITYGDVKKELIRLEDNGLNPSSIQVVDLVRRKLVKRAINNALHGN